MKTETMTDEQKILYMLDKLGDAIRGMYSRLAETDQAIFEIERKGWTDAKPHWRKDKQGEPRFLYLIHPMVNGERQREYIGADQDKVDEALAKIDRKAEVEKLYSKRSILISRIGSLRTHFTSLLRQAYEPEE